MDVTYQQTDARRYNASVVYSFTVAIDGQPILENDIPKVYNIQIMDDYPEKQQAFKDFLDRIVSAHLQRDIPTPSLETLGE